MRKNLPLPILLLAAGFLLTQSVFLTRPTTGAPPEPDKETAMSVSAGGFNEQNETEAVQVGATRLNRNSPQSLFPRVTRSFFTPGLSQPAFVSMLDSNEPEHTRDFPEDPAGYEGNIPLGGTQYGGSEPFCDPQFGDCPSLARGTHQNGSGTDDGGVESCTPGPPCTSRAGGTYFGNPETCPAGATCASNIGGFHSFQAGGFALETMPNYVAWAGRITGTTSLPQSTPRFVLSPDRLRTYLISPVTVSNGQGFLVEAENTATGAQLWNRTYIGTTGLVEPKGIMISPDGLRVFVTGYSLFSQANGTDIVVIAYEAMNGRVLWSRRYNGAGSSSDEPAGIISTFDGRVLVFGGSVGAGLYDNLIFALSAGSGIPLWTNRHNSTANGYDFFNDAAVSPTGSVVCATGPSQGNYYTSCYNTFNGARVWARSFSGDCNGEDCPGDDESIRITFDAAGAHVYVGGNSEVPGAGTDAKIIAYNVADGRPFFASGYNGSGNGNERVHTLITNGVGGWCYSGVSRGATTGDDGFGVCGSPATINTTINTRYDGPAHGDDGYFWSAISPNVQNFCLTGMRTRLDGEQEMVTSCHDLNDNGHLWTRSYYGGIAGGFHKGTYATFVNNSDILVSGTSRGLNFAQDNMKISYRAQPFTVAGADLSITKTTPHDTAGVGRNLTYTIKVTNNGPSDAVNVSVEDTLPEGVTLVEAKSSWGSCTQTNPVVCNLGTLAPKVDRLLAPASVTITIVVTPTVAGTITNTAIVKSGTPDPIPNNSSPPVTTTVKPTADLSIDKTASHEQVNLGGNLTYKLTIKNHGPADATNVKVSDRLPNGVTFISATPSQPDCDDPAPNPEHPEEILLKCNLGTLAANNTATVDIVVIPMVEGEIQNGAFVSSDEFDPSFFGSFENANQDIVSTTVLPPSADLSITKTASPETVFVGQELTYTLTVKNNGPSIAEIVKVLDTLPEGVTLIGNPVPSPSGSCGVTELSTTKAIDCKMGDLGSGASATVTIVVRADKDGKISNSATASSATTDPTPDNTTPPVETTVMALADLSIEKGAPDQLFVGQNMPYKLTIKNNGPSTATNVTVTDKLPDGVTIISDPKTTKGFCTVPAPDRVHCPLGDLKPDDPPVTVTIVVRAEKDGTITNTAQLGTSTTDPTSENKASKRTTVLPIADLSIEKADSPDPVSVGQNLTYTLTVKNHGPSDATNVRVTDILPEGVTLVPPPIVSPGSCSGTSTINCSLGTLTKNGTRTVTIVVIPTAEGTITNTATVISDTTDFNTENDKTPSVATEVLPSADVAITVTDSPDPVIYGERLTLTMTVTNNGPSTARDVTINAGYPGPAGAFFPPPVEFLSKDARCSGPAEKFNCDLGDLARDSRVELTLVVIPMSFTMNLNASIRRTDDPNLENNVVAEPTTVLTRREGAQHLKDKVNNYVTEGDLTREQGDRLIDPLDEAIEAMPATEGSSSARLRMDQPASGDRRTVAFVKAVETSSEAIGEPAGGDLGYTIAGTGDGDQQDADNDSEDDDPNTKRAIRALRRFITEVNKLIRRGKLPPTKGQPLIDDAQTIIDLLSQVRTLRNINVQMTLKRGGASDTLRLRGSIVAQIFTMSDGQALDTDGDGLDEVQMQIISADLEGRSRLVGGRFTVRLRPLEKHPFQQSLGVVEEIANLEPGRLDLSPFSPTGGANLSLNLFSEVVAADGSVYHSDDPVGLQGLLLEIRPRIRATFTVTGCFELRAESEQPNGIVVSVGTTNCMAAPFQVAGGATLPSAGDDDHGVSSTTAEFGSMESSTIDAFEGTIVDRFRKVGRTGFFRFPDLQWSG